jgi:poly-gamma-glutamate capsule biosynthesis protein CapA/YwtB (metallophosphatase superfamily)
VPHTRRGAELIGRRSGRGSTAGASRRARRCGFSALSLAGNHIADWGREGIEDTIERLDALGIAHTGAAATLDDARRPARFECRGRQLALLSYNCVGPEAAWASAERAGCNFLRIATADGSPVAPAAPLTEA